MITDIVHIIWEKEVYSWDPFSQQEDKTKLELIEKRLKWFKNPGATIIFTLYNEIPGDMLLKNFEDKTFSLFLEYADIVVHLCKDSYTTAKKFYPLINSKRNIITYHGDYLNSYEKDFKRFSKREVEYSSK